jgi:hypothetical protein
LLWAACATGLPHGDELAGRKETSGLRLFCEGRFVHPAKLLKRAYAKYTSPLDGIMRLLGILPEWQEDAPGPPTTSGRHIYILIGVLLFQIKLHAAA